jgi:hypothetical protein
MTRSLVEMVDSVWVWCYQSATIVWARAQVLVGVALGVLPDIMAVVGIPEVKDAIQASLGSTGYMWFMAGLGIVTEVCRRRTL